MIKHGNFLQLRVIVHRILLSRASCGTGTRRKPQKPGNSHVESTRKNRGTVLSTIRHDNDTIWRATAESRHHDRSSGVPLASVLVTPLTKVLCYYTVS